jgi:hypothetical protein
MNTVILDTVLGTPGIPPYLRSSLLAYWDSRNRGSVSLPLTNLVTNGDFSNGTTGWSANLGAITEAGGILTLLASAQNGDARQTVHFVNGHVYYYFARINGPYVEAGIGAYTGGNFFTNAQVSTPGSYQTISGLGTSAFTGAGRLYIVDTKASGWQNILVDYIGLVDLTAMFGAGNEPTALEMDAILANYSATSWFDGTKSLVINPNQQIFLPDTSGHGQHLKYRNVNYTDASGPQNTVPPYEKMDGTDDYMWRTLSTPLNTASAHSVVGWIRRSDWTTTRYLIGLANSGVRSRGLYTDSDAIWTLSYNDATNDPTWDTCAVTPQDNGDYMCGFRYDPSARKVSVFVNGTFGPYGGAHTNVNNPINELHISCTPNKTGQTMGDYGDICIFNKTLTDADVLALFQYSRKRYGV